MRGVFFGSILAVTFGLSSAPIEADVASDLRDFWENSGGGINVNGANSYQGQRAGYATLGSVQVRTRVRTSELAQINLPSARAGCGGIDLFAGSFSYISRDEIINLMEAIMQNAAGFAFELALESLSPAVQETVSKLRDLQAEINAMNINSCEAGQALASGLWPATDGASQHVCTTLGSYQGIFADQLASRQNCGTGGNRQSTLDQASAEMQEQIPVDINYAWNAIQKNAFLAGDREVGEFFMTLTGTFIMRAATNDNEGPVPKPIAPRAASPEMIEALVNGGTVDILRCDDEELCLDPTLEPVELDPATSLYALTYDTISEMKEGILDGESTISPEAVALLNMTSVPVLDLLITGMAFQHVFVDNEIRAMAEVVAVDLAMIYIDEALREMEAAADLITTLGETTEGFQDSVNETQNNFSDVRLLAYERYSAALRTLERLRMAKSELAGHTGSRFASMIGSE